MMNNLQPASIPSPPSQFQSATSSGAVAPSGGHVHLAASNQAFPSAPFPHQLHTAPGYSSLNQPISPIYGHPHGPSNWANPQSINSQLFAGGQNQFNQSGYDHFAAWAATQHTGPPSHPHIGLVAQSGNSSFSDTCARIDSWIPDSGATSHMTSDPSLVNGAQVYHGSEKVVIGNGTFLNITHIGHSTIKLPNCTLLLKFVLLVPGLTKNLLSIAQLVRDNPCVIEFSYLGFFVKDLTGMPIHHIPRNTINIYSLSLSAAVDRLSSLLSIVSLLWVIFGMLALVIHLFMFLANFLF